MQEGKRLWGGKPSSLGRQERIGGDAQDPVVMESSPTAPLVVIEANFVLQLLEVSLNAPAQLDQADEILSWRCRGRIREPVLGGLCRRCWPLDHEPFFFPRSRAPVVTVGGSYATKRKPRLHRSACALPPTDRPIRRGRKRAGQREHGDGLMPRRAAQQFRRATHSLPAPWRQWRA